MDHSDRESSRDETWIDTFVDEKGYDLHQTFVVVGPSGMRNIIRLGEVVEEIKNMEPAYQDSIKKVMIKLDFNDPEYPLKMFKVLAEALAK